MEPRPSPPPRPLTDFSPDVRWQPGRYGYESRARRLSRYQRITKKQTAATVPEPDCPRSL